MSIVSGVAIGYICNFLFCYMLTHTHHIHTPHTVTPHTHHTLQVCLFCSAGYHMFNCQSEMVHKRWFSLDLMGVSVGLIGCYFPGALLRLPLPPGEGGGLGG